MTIYKASTPCTQPDKPVLTQSQAGQNVVTTAKYKGRLIAARAVCTVGIFGLAAYQGAHIARQRQQHGDTSLSERQGAACCVVFSALALMALNVLADAMVKLYGYRP